MTTQTVLEGMVEAADLDPITRVRSYLPRGTDDNKKVDYYGKRGVYVILSPIHGLTPPSVFRNNKSFGFQVPPIDSFGEDGSFAYNDYDTISAGQHSQPSGRQLRSVSFRTMFIDWQPEWSLVHTGSGQFAAQKAVRELCAIRDHGKPFRLRVHQTQRADFEVDYAATLRSVRWEIEAGEIDCYYVNVSFTEFTTPNIKMYLASGGGHKLPTTVQVKNLGTKRNTLAKLAKFYYGDPTAARQIAAANGLKDQPFNRVLTAKSLGRAKLTIPRRTVRRAPRKKK